MGNSIRTAFILGAGASLQAGYPFIKVMGEELFEWMRQSREVAPYDFNQAADFLEERFGNNIEDLFNGMQAEIDERKTGYFLFANTYRPCLIEAMRQWFTDIHQRNEALSYEKFAREIVKPGDVIITFNYDVSLDSKLCKSGTWSVGDGYGFTADGLPMGSAVKLFKLHGSINWLALLFAVPSAGAFGTRPVFTDDCLTALGYVDLTDPILPRSGSPAVQPLVLPTNRKQFSFQTTFGNEWQGFWDHLWNSARTVLQTGERIVICGYGMYPVDQRGCDLLLEGELTAAVEVCCGAESSRIVEQLRQHGRRADQAKQTFFEDWVSAQAGQ